MVLFVPSLEPLPGSSEAQLFICQFREGPLNGAGQGRQEVGAGRVWAGVHISRARKRRTERAGMGLSLSSLLGRRFHW